MRHRILNLNDHVVVCGVDRHAVRFLDEMLRDRTGNWRIEEIRMPKGSAFAGRTLQADGLRRTHEIAVLAVRTSDGSY